MSAKLTHWFVVHQINYSSLWAFKYGEYVDGNYFYCSLIYLWEIWLEGFKRPRYFRYTWCAVRSITWSDEVIFLLWQLKDEIRGSLFFLSPCTDCAFKSDLCTLLSGQWVLYCYFLLNVVTVMGGCEWMTHLQDQITSLKWVTQQ